MRRGRICAFVAAMALAAQAAAEPPAAWEEAAEIGDRAWSDVQARGVLAVGAHAADIEAALAEGRRIGLQFADGDTTYVLTDGAMDTLTALLGALADDEATRSGSVAIENPYPLMALMLGSYYVEVRRPQDALRVLDDGLAMLAGSARLAETHPSLVAERGMALTMLGRHEEAVANFDDGLEPENLDPAARAHLLRGRGFALIELGRLDDAEKAYRDSLALEPGNATAENELDYIAQLRAGGASVAPSLAPLQPETDGKPPRQ